MTQTTAAAPPGPPALAVAAGVLGLVGAAVATLMAIALVGLGALTEGEGGAGWWLAGLLVAAVAQAWGALRLLRRSGWVLLAVASVPGLLPAVALFGVWLEYRQDPSIMEALAAVPLVTLLVTVLPPVRRWAAPRALREGTQTPRERGETLIPDPRRRP